MLEVEVWSLKPLSLPRQEEGLDSGRSNDEMLRPGHLDYNSSRTR
jgi:hypothetical protein